MTLRENLSQFDGKSVKPLQELLEKFPFQPEHVDTLVSIIEDEEESYQIASSWLLHQSHTLKSWIQEDEKSRIIELLNQDLPWQVKLHLLQIFPHLPLKKKDVPECVPLLEKLTEHKRPFIRAWAYNALCALGDIDRAMQPSIVEKLRLGMEGEKASVGARIRNAAKARVWCDLT